MTFGAWLLATRTSRVPPPLQKDLARVAAELDAEAPESDRATFSQARVSEWERGVRLPDLRQFTILTIALDCTDAERAAGRAAWEADQLRGLHLSVA